MSASALARDRSSPNARWVERDLQALKRTLEG
jgi:hypothetical protein